ncbi:acetolactate synthase-1/2/3 large subunit [Pseudonocardia sediminis]|uniref:Acetolactate synthase-1/2/3 large subunit n=1 Tax=Pseudonocardia sediminis TaxID=1397368 RepID=A0A4Q7UYE5_PSEST|nr:thiamine pyrophosphate-binding protein [Pseudonocardia sediminis]RZT87082.1 acetolactate synthase-1/2/3 large subunit [Pseudonocardia sediminis]
MDQTRTVADDVLDVLRTAGATTVFGLPGVHNLAFFSTGPGSPVVVRHEQAATYAADGWARRTGALGAAVVTTGPGATNALTGFGEAAAAGSPVVLVASEIPQRLRRDGRLRGVLHESRDQAALFAPLAKAVFSPRTPEETARDIRLATALALAAPRGPVYLDVPADVLPVDAFALHTPTPPPPGAPSPAATTSGPGAQVHGTPDPSSRSAAADLLRDRSVVVWAGAGALDAPTGIAALAAHLGAPLVPSFHARGLPGAVGVPPHEPEVAAMIGSADVLLAVGGDLDGMNTRNWTMPRPPVLLTVDAAEPADPPEWTADAALTGPVAALLDDLRAAVPSREPWWPADVTARVRTRLRDDPASAEAFALVEAVETATATGAALVCDMAVAGYWAGGYARVAGPRGLAYPVGWGTLGFGLPAAVGVAATGVPTLAVVGDGGLAMGLGELATLVQERLPATVLVVDDAGYGMLRYDQDRAGHPHAGVDLHTPDLLAVAVAFGMATTDVATIGLELATALSDALASGAPHLVRVGARLLPPRTTSPRWSEE